MTYAGIKSMIYCGVGKDDPRMKKALEWIQQELHARRQPGHAGGARQRGLYYYYHTMAKTPGRAGRGHVRRRRRASSTTGAPTSRGPREATGADGSWSTTPSWMEGDPNLVTGYALMALSYCRPKK